MSLIDGRPRSATVTAGTPMVLLVIDARSFSALLSDVPPLRRKVLVGLCDRLRNADAALAARN
jgi:CRP-like cAMP-binding protein